MSYNDKTYVIINSSDISNMDFGNNEGKVLNKGDLRKSTDGTKAIVQYEWAKPSCINGSLTTYTHEEMLDEINNTSGIWYFTEESWKNY